MTVTDFLRPEHWLTPAGGPLYVQLRKRIEAGIASGYLTPDMPLPPEREIAAVTELSRVTVRKAMADLAEQGAVVQRQGSGSYVAPRRGRVEQSLSRLTSFSEDMARRGLQTDVRWLQRGLFEPNADEVAALNLPSGAQVARLARLRLADGQPMAIERASLPTAILANPLIVETSLYRVLAQAGFHLVRATQKISAINLAADDAHLLGLPAHAAGLQIARVTYLDDGRVAEFTRSVYRGDTYDFVAELQLGEGAT